MSIILWNQHDIKAALPGVTASLPFAATGVSIDTRTLKPGDLFIAIKGETMDGHDFLAKAHENGACAAIISQDVPSLPADFPVINVSDTLKAMEELGKYARNRCPGTFIGLTGSVGKTTCKTMLAYMLSAFGETYATEGNLNNHIGVPLTLMRTPQTSQFVIIEMGMNHAEEIRHISKMAQPHIAMITTVEAVHIEYFKNVEAIAKAKAEIFEGMVNKGVAVLPFDSPYYLIMEVSADQWGASKRITFGTSANATIRMVHYQQEAQGGHVDAVIEGQPFSYKIGMFGEHMAINSLANLGIIHALSLDVQKAANLLQGFSALPGRGKLYPLQINNINFSLCDDSYNASPASMRAAITQLSHAKGRKIAVLGDMLELGNHALALHTGLAHDITKQRIDMVCTSGHFMRHLHGTLPHHLQGPCAEDPDTLYPQLIACLKAGDTVLVKGSHGSHVHKIVTRLLEEAKPVS
ncbi:MAG: UDP-N-acetylmuramoyl-tripeptide--D-alanyl-D-alanine ligase [Alphaproteobacteria bacterium]|nr:UDP-N-acetylmuramoyl-tripeptide--D-alanyl-D-alanine ligase [Alphaproteobacteria bacterium]